MGFEPRGERSLDLLDISDRFMHEQGDVPLLFVSHVTRPSAIEKSI